MIKKCVIFGTICAGLFFIMQMVTGIVLTSLYVPDLDAAWKMSDKLSKNVIMTNETSFFTTAVFLLFSLGLSYIITKKITNKQKSVSQ